MKYLWISLILAVVVLLSAFANQPQDKDYKKQWKLVEKYADQGLPRSALEVVNEIYKQAKKDNNTPQFIKAVINKISFRSQFEVNYNEKAISDISEEVEKTQKPVRKAILHSVLGELYWNYYKQNRYQISNRSQVDVDSSRLSTWDIRTILAEAKKHYLQSIQNSEKLAGISLDVYSEILKEEDYTEGLRPTLYDFLAYRSLRFMKSSDYLLTEANLEVYYNDSKYFSDIEAFAKLDLDKKNSRLLPLHVYQKLLEIHKDAPKALSEANLQRLEFVYENYTRPDKEERYLESLEGFASKVEDSPEWALVQYKIAELYYSPGRQVPYKSEQTFGDPKKAMKHCEMAIEKYPGTYGAKKAEGLKQQILRKNLSVDVEYGNLPGGPFPASVSYRNVDELHTRIIRLSPDGEWLTKRMSREEKLSFLKNRKAMYSRTVPLPATGDYRRHSTEVKVPELEEGFYVLLAASSGDFSFKEEVVAFSEFWVTDLTFVNRENNNGDLILRILEREEGDAVKNARIDCYTRRYDHRKRQYNLKKARSYESDRDGKVKIAWKDIERESFFLDIQDGDDRVFSKKFFYLGEPRDRDNTDISTYIFTDRAVYRPGQTIHFKGVVLEKEGEETNLKKGYSTGIELKDANRQKISEKSVTTNEYGSFSGSFILPESTLTGDFRIITDEGRTTVKVEEYRRPRFKVELKPMEGTYRLNETVEVTGKAEAFAGYPVDGAKVKYTVKRKTRFPFPMRYFIPRPASPEYTLTSGTTQTQSDGSFSLQFETLPDPTVSRDTKPVFDFEVSVEVTDKNGETHTAKRFIAAGYDSFIPRLKVDEVVDKQQPLKIIPDIENLSGETINAEGVLSVYRLKDFDRLMKDRKWAQPDSQIYSKEAFAELFEHYPYESENKIESLPVDKRLVEEPFYTGTDSLITRNIQEWPVGAYKLVFDVSKNRETHKVEKWITVYDSGDDEMPLNQYAFFKTEKQTAEPGEKVTVLLGSAARKVKAVVKAEQDGNIFFEEELMIRDEVEKVQIPVKEKHRGGFGIHAYFVKDNQLYSFTEKINVPWSNKKLEIDLAVKETPLTPGGMEEWTVTVKGPDAEKTTAELLAGMYDASLDEIAPHKPWNLGQIYPEYSLARWYSNNMFTLASGQSLYDMEPAPRPRPRTHPRLNWFGYRHMEERMYEKSRTMEMAVEAKSAESNKAQQLSETVQGEGPKPQKKSKEKKKPVQVREDFNETAFFYPQMVTKDGKAKIKFTLPESLTEWKFMAFAQTKDLKTGQMERTFEARKELMIVPNPPRFVRQGDAFAFSAKVVNLTEEEQEITVTLDMLEPYPETLITETLGLKNNQRKITVPANESRQVTFGLNIPDTYDLLKYRITAANESFSDGKTEFLPVLTNKKRIIETHPFSLSKPGSRTLDLPSVKKEQVESMTLEYTGNAAWYAVQALPYMEEGSSKSALSVMNRFYANSLAYDIVKQNPEIEKVFQIWKEKDSDALRSNLEKNQELKNIVLEHTPWLLDAKSETADKKRIANFFQKNKIENELSKSLYKLQNLQASNGGWSWYEGMPQSWYITQKILKKLADLEKLGATHTGEIREMINDGLEFCDEELIQHYEKLRRDDDFKPEEYKPSAQEVLYLYTRALFPDYESKEKAGKIEQEYLQQTAKYWTDYNHYMKGMIAFVQDAHGKQETAESIIASLREHALQNKEMGMFWRDFRAGWQWYQAPIDFQALMIRLFDKVADDKQAGEKMKLWLLKQKQTQRWPTSSATANAVFALLSTGEELLSPQGTDVTFKVGDKTITPDKQDVQTGTAYFKKSWEGSQVSKGMSEIEVEKKDESVSWGSVYVQYFKELSEVESHATKISVKKDVYRVKQTDQGDKLVKLTQDSRVEVGDRIRYRIVLESDRTLEYVHLGDGRAAGFEPTANQSGYHHQDGLAYYRAIKDASVDFFIQYMRPGTYVLEYDMFAEQSGTFSNGIATLQSLYAPEFSAHSKGQKIVVE
ncbi:MAG: hypothetical protein K9J27_00005 [Bacteroidales bacterium]|nr:hypothetical protein [Bacteroidales bacterium]MCF8333332.1 hypothetical protein [Bacteroidales bacterium]